MKQLSLLACWRREAKSEPRMEASLKQLIHSNAKKTVKLIPNVNTSTCGMTPNPSGMAAGWKPLTLKKWRLKIMSHLDTNAVVSFLSFFVSNSKFKIGYRFSIYYSYSLWHCPSFYSSPCQCGWRLRSSSRGIKQDCRHNLEIEIFPTEILLQ